MTVWNLHGSDRSEERRSRPTQVRQGRRGINRLVANGRFLATGDIAGRMVFSDAKGRRCLRFRGYGGDQRARVEPDGKSWPWEAREARGALVAIEECATSLAWRSVALGRARRERGDRSGQVRRGQRNVESAIVFEITDAFGARYRHNVIALSNHPSQGGAARASNPWSAQIFHMRRGS